MKHGPFGPARRRRNKVARYDMSKRGGVPMKHPSDRLLELDKGAGQRGQDVNIPAGLFFAGQAGKVTPMTAASSSRSPMLDLTRGWALLGMAIFHFTFDLVLFGHLPGAAISTGFMPVFARLIAGGFLFLSGVAFWLAHGAGLRAGPFWRRFAILLLAALAISLVTRIAMGDLWVRFGILHALAACSLLGLALRRAPPWLLALLAATILALPSLLSTPGFNAPWLFWLGLATETPPMLDFEPLLPWAAPFLAGLTLAKWGTGRPWWQRMLYPAQGQSRMARLQWAGRHSLAIYLIHQPVLYSLVWVTTLALR